MASIVVSISGCKGFWKRTFATVTTAIDNTGHYVCYVTGLGKLTTDIFTDLFEKHLNNPAYVCTDANSLCIVIIAIYLILLTMKDHQII